jgi:succinate-semialdehyde dehydrogenase/glutarate-semialdehyde dehydrogenase
MRCAGQVCSAPSRFFVEEAVSKSFTEQMVKLSQALTVGNGLEQGVQMGPLATSRQLQRAQRLVADARAKGARVVCGGGRPRGSNQGYFFEPTILTDVPPDAAIMHEEPFTPIAAIVAVSSAQEAVARANEVEFGLAAYVFSRSGNAIDQMTAQLEAGVIGVNTVAVALPEAPFGGVKHSGYGREGGVEGIHDFVNTKFVHRFRS